MSSTQQVATSNPTSFQLPTMVRPPEAPVPVVVPQEPPPPPKDSFLTKAGKTLDGVRRSTLGEAVARYSNFVGAVAGYALPAAALYGGAQLIAETNRGDSSEVLFAVCAGGAAALGQAIFQGSEGLGNIKLYKKQGYRFPRLASFIEVTLCLVAPALAGAYFGGQHFGPWWGNAIGCGAAIAMSSFALVHHDVRTKRTY